MLYPQFDLCSDLIGVRRWEVSINNVGLDIEGGQKDLLVKVDWVRIDPQQSTMRCVAP